MLKKPIERTMKCGTTVRIQPYRPYTKLGHLMAEIDGRGLTEGPIIQTIDEYGQTGHHSYVRFVIGRKALPGVLAMIRRAFPSRKRTAK